MKHLFTTLSFCAIAALSFASDIITLTNDSTFIGKVKRIKKCTVVFEVDNEKYDIPASDIYSIQFGDTTDAVYRKHLELLQDDPNACLNGINDAINFHGKKGGHVLLGFLFGPFAMIGTALANPSPYKGQETPYASKNSALFTDPAYLKCYKKKAKGQLIGMEALGWGIWIVIVLASGGA